MQAAASRFGGDPVCEFDRGGLRQSSFGHVAAHRRDQILHGAMKSPAKYIVLRKCLGHLCLARLATMSGCADNSSTGGREASMGVIGV